MKDNYHKEINYLRISITDKCNLRCIYCMPPVERRTFQQNELLSVQEIIQIVRAAARCGISKVRITGGEPLVHKEIYSICNGIASIPQIKELCVTTNGVLLSDMAQELRNCGVNRINISIDSLQPEKYKKITRLGNLDDAFKGIAAAEKAGFKNIKINTVLLGGINDDEISDFVDLTLINPWEIRFIELMPIGETKDWSNNRFVSSREVLKIRPDLIPEDINGVAERYKLKNSVGYVGLISPLSHSFCSECNRIRVTADGRLKPCLHSDDEIYIKGLSEEIVYDKISYGIMSKPKQHSLLTNNSLSHRNMNQIGG